MRRKWFYLYIRFFSKIFFPALVVGAVVSTAILANLVLSNNINSQGATTHARLISPQLGDDLAGNHTLRRECENVDADFKNILIWFVSNMWGLVLGVMANRATKQIDALD